MIDLYAITGILMPDNVKVEPKTVFKATVRQAKQFDKLGAARPATEAEIKAHREAKAIANAMDPDAPELELPAPAAAKAPPSGAPGDPQSNPKGAKG